MTATSTTRSAAAAACAPGTALYAEIVEFLYQEADLLDTNRFSDWLALFATDIHYTMPVRTTQFRNAGDGFQDVGFFEENFVSLQTRVKRLETEFAWAEAPPSRTRHYVSNVLVKPGSAEGEYDVQINFMVTRTRMDRGYQLFTGRREDTLRRMDDGELRIAKRRILPDQTVMTNSNLSVFF